MTAAPKRLLVADDHPIITEGLRRFFAASEAAEVVATASDIDALHGALRTVATVDVVILDVQIPGMFGADTVRAIVAEGPRVVLFTHHDPDDVVARLIEAGAAGYVSKSAPITELLDAITAVLEGRRWLCPALEECLAKGGEAPLHEQLTARERDVLGALVQGKSAKEIGFELDLASSTVYTHIERVRKKLGATSLHDLRLYAERHRLRF